MLKVKIIKRIALIFALALPVYANAGLRVLDFDYDAHGNKIQDGQIIDNEYANWGVTIQSCNFSGSPDAYTSQVNGVCAGHDKTDRQSAFNTLNRYTPDPDLEFRQKSNGDFVTRQTGDKYDPLSSAEEYYSDLYGAHDPRADTWKSPGNVLIINEEKVECDGRQCEGPNDEGARPAGFFVFEFTDAVDILSLDFFDIEVKEAQRAGNDAKIFFFLENGEIEERNVPGVGNNNYTRINYEGLFNVTKMVLNMPGSGAINNLVYKHSQEVSAPSILAIMIIMLGAMVYRKNNT